MQIDGRAVYNPIFSGVFWQTEDLLLQDVERIGIHGGSIRLWVVPQETKQQPPPRVQEILREEANAGVAPLTYLQNLRMRLAEQGLRDGAMSVSELAESLGYESDSAFSNAFKRRTGMAPKQYQSVLTRMDRPTSHTADPNPHHPSLSASITSPASTRHRQT